MKEGEQPITAPTGRKGLRVLSSPVGVLKREVVTSPRSTEAYLAKIAAIIGETGEQEK